MKQKDARLAAVGFGTTSTVPHVENSLNEDHAESISQNIFEELSKLPKLPDKPIGGFLYDMMYVPQSVFYDNSLVTEKHLEQVKFMMKKRIDIEIEKIMFYGSDIEWAPDPDITEIINKNFKRCL
jgi:hypothetical protein